MYMVLTYNFICNGYVSSKESLTTCTIIYNTNTLGYV